MQERCYFCEDLCMFCQVPSVSKIRGRWEIILEKATAFEDLHCAVVEYIRKNSEVMEDCKKRRNILDDRRVMAEVA